MVPPSCATVSRPPGRRCANGRGRRWEFQLDATARRHRAHARSRKHHFRLCTRTRRSLDAFRKAGLAHAIPLFGSAAPGLALVDGHRLAAGSLRTLAHRRGLSDRTLGRGLRGRQTHRARPRRGGGRPMPGSRHCLRARHPSARRPSSSRSAVGVQRFCQSGRHTCAASSPRSSSIASRTPGRVFAPYPGEPPRRIETTLFLYQPRPPGRPGSDVIACS